MGGTFDGTINHHKWSHMVVMSLFISESVDMKLFRLRLSLMLSPH